MARRAQTLLILVIIFGVGVWTVAWYGPRMLSEARATSSWPTVTGTIESSQAVSRNDSSRRGTDHVVELVYRYVVDDAVLRGSRWSVAGDLIGASRADAETRARAYRKGDEVTVHYDPDDPARAVLFAGGPDDVRKAWMTIVFGALCVLIAIGAGLRELLRR